MEKRKKSNADAPPIGERLLTLRETADVLRLSTRTVREYLQRGEIEKRIIACGGDSGTLSLLKTSSSDFHSDVNM